MDESTGVGGDIADDHEFQVAQDGEVPPNIPGTSPPKRGFQ